MSHPVPDRPPSNPQAPAQQPPSLPPPSKNVTHPPPQAPQSAQPPPPPHRPYGEGVESRQLPPPIPSPVQRPPNAPGVPPAPGHFYPQYPVSNPADAHNPQHYPVPPPPQDNRALNKQKKEIKRRTKTGCLTCRKRRIKCDEGHPSCRNCQKSKRECLGYDPIFKPQAGSIGGSASHSQYQSPNTSTSGYLAPLPRTYPLANYGLPTATPLSESAEIAEERDNDGEDSALEQRSESGDEADGSQNMDKPTVFKIEDLLCLNGVSPPPPVAQSEITDSTRQEIETIYANAYAPGMDRFFETKWYSERGLPYLLGNPLLCSQFATLITRYNFNRQDPNHYSQFSVTQSLEAIVVWSMLAMCKKVSTPTEEGSNIPSGDIKEGVKEAARRLDTFEALVTSKPISAEAESIAGEAHANGNALQNQLKSREQDFWRSVRSFVSQPDDGSNESAKSIEDTLAKSRGLLESRENRDVIYSIMVARYFGPQVPGFPEMLKPPETNDERNMSAKVAVAKKLLEDEAGGRGTNQVVQRLCGIAVRSWDLMRR